MADFVSFLVLSTLLCLFISQSHSMADNEVAEYQNPPKPKKVTLSLYYESLNRNCRNFIVNKLGEMFDTDLHKIVSLRMVPWGNARKLRIFNETIICQNGPSECYLNTIQACAVNVWPAEKHFKFIHCIESQDLSFLASEAVWRGCSDDLELSQDPIDHCYRSGEGKKLILRNGEETEQLVPKKRFIPWVTVNDRPLQEDYRNYTSYVCKAYRGKRPYACRSYWQKSTVNETLTGEVSYEEEEKVPGSSEMKMERP
ncbi:hypothetical protein Pint_34933 [Pistacia integerrima]|uniref:Uncharacterized protein n=1 Tax=Pistacia integerrima TaxID=434235 RepID=A0ACC0Y1R5_9ROSI|nr:hypothetical protein Pint_34933 [Pistacia integerrima]